jgi:hypothetical protein
MTWTDMRRDLAIPAIGREGKAEDVYARRGGGAPSSCALVHKGREAARLLSPLVH